MDSNVHTVCVSLKLWPCQRRLMRAYASVSGKNVLFSCATGGGKSRLIAASTLLWMLKPTHLPWQRALIVVTNEYDAKQMHEKIAVFLPHGAVVVHSTNSKSSVKHAKVIITTVSALTLTSPPMFALAKTTEQGVQWVHVGDLDVVFDLVLLDECHNLCARLASEKILLSLLKSVRKIVGLSATPWRHLKGEWRHMLACLRDHEDLTLSYRELRALGHLKQIKAVVVPCVGAPAKTAADTALHEEAAVYAEACRLLHVHRHDTVLIKCLRRNTCVAIANGLLGGQRMPMLIGQMDAHEQMLVVRATKRGAVRALVGTDKIRTGVDFGSSVNVIIELRMSSEYPGMTKNILSTGSMVQLVGRASRGSGQAVYYVLCGGDQLEGSRRVVQECVAMGIVVEGEGSAPIFTARAQSPPPPKVSQTLTVAMPYCLRFHPGGRKVSLVGNGDLRDYVQEQSTLIVGNRALRVARTQDVRPIDILAEYDSAVTTAIDALAGRAAEPLQPIFAQMASAPVPAVLADIGAPLVKHLQKYGERGRIARFDVAAKQAVSRVELLTSLLRRHTKKIPAVGVDVAVLAQPYTSMPGAACTLDDVMIEGAPMWLRQSFHAFLCDVSPAALHVVRHVVEQPLPVVLTNGHLAGTELGRQIFNEEHAAPISNDCFLRVVRALGCNDVVAILEVITTQGERVADESWSDRARLNLRVLKNWRIVFGNMKNWWVVPRISLLALNSAVRAFKVAYAREHQGAALRLIQLESVARWLAAIVERK